MFSDRKATLGLTVAAALAAAFFIAAGPHPVTARTRPNPEGRTVRAPGTGELLGVSSPRSASVSAPRLAAAPAPLPVGAVAIDSTYYDLQDMGSFGIHILSTADGKVHVAYQKCFCELDAHGCPPDFELPNPFPERGMAYAVRSTGGVWTRVGKVQDPGIRGCCVTEVFGGFGNLALTANGRAVVAQHMNEDGCDLRGDLYLQNAVGGATWKAYLTPITDPSYLFPQAASAAGGAFALVGEVPAAGSYDEVEEFRVSRLAAEGQSFVCPTGWQLGAWRAVAPPALFRDGRPAFPAASTGSDGRVGIAAGDFGGNVYLFESADGSFAPGTITTTQITQYTDATITAPDSTSTAYRAFIHCHLAYRGTTPHVVWSELQARRIGGEILYFDYRCRIRHWDPVGGVTTVRQVQPGEADTYDEIDEGRAGPIAGFNTISVDWPQVGFSADGSETYVAWLRFVDDEVDPSANAGLPGIVTGVGYGDIAFSVSRNGGPWSPAVNVTATPTTDERYVALAPANHGGVAHLLFQASATDEAGTYIIGDRGPDAGPLLRRLAYLAVTPGANAVADAPPAPHLPVLEVIPNPARGRLEFRLPAQAAGSSGARVSVLNASGRVVARLEIGQSGGVVTWDGKDGRGRLVPAGAYLAWLEGAGPVAARKFLILP